MSVDLNLSFKKLSDGDKSAFSDIYNELKNPIYVFIYRMTGQKEISEDLTADTFLKVFSSPPDSSVNNKKAYVFKVARNLTIDALRKKQNVGLDDVEISEKKLIDDTIERMDIEEAMKRITYEQRSILSLHIIGELGFKEISEITGLSVPSVFRRYRKALKSLQSILSGGVL